MIFGQKKILPQKNNTDDCKIKIKQTAQGKIVSVSGKCTKEQLMALKEFSNNEPIRSDRVEESY